MIADQLVKAAKRRLTAAFEALRQLLLTSPTDCYWVVLETTNELLLLLRKVRHLDTENCKSSIATTSSSHVGCRATGPCGMPMPRGCTKVDMRCSTKRCRNFGIRQSNFKTTLSQVYDLPAESSNKIPFRNGTRRSSFGCINNCSNA